MRKVFFATKVRAVSGLWTILTACFCSFAAEASYCAQWDLASTPVFQIHQDNGFVLWVTFQQNDTQLGGYATGQSEHFGEQPSFSGAIDGRFTCVNTYTFTAHWGGGPGGVYTGRIDPNGATGGQTFDPAHPESRTRWAAVGGRARCVWTTHTRRRLQLC